MFLLLNGAFGVGKSTVARLLRQRLNGAAIADPELIGFVIQRLPGRRALDYQDAPAWRRLTVLWARTVGLAHRTVILPMTFSHVPYLREVREGLAASGRSVLHVCLTAPLGVVRERLTARGEPEQDPRRAWVHRRAAECCAVHGGPEFATQVPTENRSPAEVADAVAGLVDSIGLVGRS